MKRDNAIDLHFVRSVHVQVHERLCNWARWCRGGGRGSSMHPMFREYRNDYAEPTGGGIPVDSMDGHLVEKAVVHLPGDIHRTVLQWTYVRPYVPVMRVRRALGLTTPALCDAIHDARTMLKNSLPIQLDGRYTLRPTDAESGLHASLKAGAADRTAE